MKGSMPTTFHSANLIRTGISSQSTFSFPLLVKEHHGIDRVNEPVTVGVPLPKGCIFAPSGLTLYESAQTPIPLQVQVVDRWSDRSIRWALLDFQATVSAKEETRYRLCLAPETTPQSGGQSSTASQSMVDPVVTAENSTFFFDQQFCKPFDRIVVQDLDMLAEGGSHLVLIDEADQAYEPRVQQRVLETTGPIRTTVKLIGILHTTQHDPKARVIVRLNFYPRSNVVAMQVTLHNPRAASHAGGLWDLGDQGSFFFKSFSLLLPMRTHRGRRIGWTTQHSRALKEEETEHFAIYQDSSGGENWQSTNHVNRFGKTTPLFRGYRVTADQHLIEEGDRALPVLVMQDQQKSVAVTVDRFWQNFPTALAVCGNQLILGLFPAQHSDLYELQGGEQKTQTIYMSLAGPEDRMEPLNWVHHRLIPRMEPEYYANSRAFSYVTPQSTDSQADCCVLVETAIEGPQSFFARREIIDEYGWRHFGDLYADHEAVKHEGASPLVSHYNNQYDALYGMIVQYIRSGDQRWFELMRDLAGHVIDIDIYHTEGDRPAYNGGLFWHTDHYLDAATATHRTYSRAAGKIQSQNSYGGGPSNEHNYATGLLHYYFLTGDEAAREAVQGLADWVINMDRGSRHGLGYLDRRPTGLCSATVDRNYHGPGRGAGNSLSVLLDAYRLTRQDRYLAKAEQVIRRCIHPKDHIQQHHLEDIEHRWSYTVFLQALGKFLEYKAEKDELDFMYGYARASLLHYAEWMSTHETPYSQVLDRVEIPTETWPAQDIRKCWVFHIAAKHAAEPLRSVLKEKANFFFHTCIQDLRSWPTCTLMRPLVLLMTNAHVQAYFQQHQDETAPQPSRDYDFGQPHRFLSQFAELYWLREKLSRVVRVTRRVAQCLGNIA